MSLQPHQERVVQEKKELDEKIEKLQAFLKTEKFNDIDIDEQERLDDQLDVMQEYSTILLARIEAFQ